MKIFIPVVAALTFSTASGTSWVDSLTPITNTDSYHMKPVRMVHARAQSDAPVWIDSLKAFGSKYGGSTDALKFRGALDTVNTASVEGALMYVQAEGIDYSERSDADKCNRKNWMQYIVFYDIVFAQTNETLAEYASEYGLMLPMDGGQCTPTSGTSDFSRECISINGNATVPEIGPFIGGMLKDSDVRAPYLNCWWYSFPNTCPLSKWTTDPKKTDKCRASTRQGLCDFDKLPDGITCTYNYRILGYVPIDDVVGITSLAYTNGTKYSSFNEFCLDGGIEFKTNTDGSVQNIDFWNKPLNTTANAARAKALVDKYASLLVSKTSTQITSDTFTYMQALPTVATLTTGNPPCYKNIKTCAESTHGCKRDLYGQICTECTADSSECVKKASKFTFPTLAKATVDGELTLNASTGSSGDSNETTPTPTPTSSAATGAMTVGALVAAFGFALLMG